MELINCVECGQLFVRVTSQNNCIDCAKKQRQEFAILKQYIRDNPSISLQELSYETGLSLNKIINWVKEGSIQLK